MINRRLGTAVGDYVTTYMLFSQVVGGALMILGIFTRWAAMLTGSCAAPNTRAHGDAVPRLPAERLLPDPALAPALDHVEDAAGRPALDGRGLAGPEPLSLAAHRAKRGVAGPRIDVAED